jgi:RNA polymerase sigma factor (sigma-70 family)
MVGSIDMDVASDDDLFLYMSFYDQPGDRVTAEAAFGVFHGRYATELHARCRTICNRYRQPNSFAEDLVSLTLHRALKGANTYKGPSTRGRTMAWLCRIARNALIDAHRNPNRPNLLNNATETDLGAENYSPEDFTNLYHEFESPLLSQEHWKLVTQAFEELDERTQRVLVETLVQRAKSPKHQYMYRGTAALLADRLGITVENLRRIRLNGMKALEAKLKSYQTQTEARHGIKK